MSEIAIQVNKVTKIYRLYNSPIDRFKEALHPFKKKYHDNFYALNNASLEIKKGESVGIVGMNGSGKSTLLKIISGIVAPTEGTVVVNGRISALLELGVGFNPEFSGLENVQFQCALLGFDSSETERLLSEIVAFADIGDFIHQPVKSYSSGMYVRLAFAVAINVDPDILIVDEALAVGDAYFQVKCMNKIRSFMNASKTLVFVSHDPGAIKSLCNRAYLLNKGVVLDSGDPDRVFNFYNGLIAEKQQTTSGQSRKNLSERSGNGRATITSVSILDQQGTTVDTVTTGETIRLKIDIKFEQRIVDPTIGILIRDRLGNDIFGVNNALMKISIGVIEAGRELSVEYRLSCDLGPNIYSLTVALHASETHVEDNFDWFNNAVVFRVVPTAEDRFIGYCRLRPTFHWNLIN